eukprot:CAMPEP_0182420386 /NCGR_PEP_ID=MMETSP1167-20130531/5142_1 /TAXON_ID=2988 /ORGANISM="Mallomonas Sp, Strain CCMP3275" /LENGTH=233 /DNA_ID=CAMNT_0024596257 /DNA_START=70 /DNA_END=771 /DNA_ORIENTATION=-
MSEFAKESLDTVNVDAKPLDTTPDGESKENAEDSNVEGEDGESGPESSAENIIPMKKLKNGLFVALGVMAATAERVKGKAIEINESEAVQNFKNKTQETATGYYEAAQPTLDRARAVSVSTYDKAVEVATPVWEKTCEVGTLALNKYVEVAEAVAPVAEKAIENVKPVVERGIENIKPVTDKVQEVVTASAEKFKTMTGMNPDADKEPYAPSALDSATKGGAMNVPADDNELL